MKITQLKTLIEKRYPNIAFLDKSDNENLILEFNTGNQKDYNYTIWLGIESMCASIGARLMNSNDDEYFWHYPYEPYNSISSEEKIIDSMEFIIEVLDVLTSFKTRIIQKNNLLTQTFICEVLKDNIWTTYYKHSVLKTNFVFPTIEDNYKLYQ